MIDTAHSSQETTTPRIERQPSSGPDTLKEMQTIRASVHMLNTNAEARVAEIAQQAQDPALESILVEMDRVKSEWHAAADEAEAQSVSKTPEQPDPTRLVALQDEIAELQYGFGVEPLPILNYDPFAITKGFIGDKPMEQAEAQLRYMKYRARMTSETRVGLATDKVAARAKPEQTADSLEEVRTVIRMRLSELSEEGVPIIKENPWTGKPVSESSIKALEYTQEAAEMIRETRALEERWGAQHAPETVYDPYTGHEVKGEYMKIRIRRDIVRLHAVKEAENGLTSLGVELPKFDMYTGKPVTEMGYESKLSVYSVVLQAEHLKLQGSLDYVPDFHPQTHEPLPSGSLQQLRVGKEHRRLTGEEYRAQQLLKIRAEKTGRPTDKPPIKPGEVFSAQDELKRIRALPRGESRMALLEYRQKQEYQLKGQALWRGQFMQDVRYDAATPLEYFQTMIEEYSKRYGFTGEQVQSMNDIVNTYRNNHSLVVRTRIEYSDDAELFYHLMGFKPKGKVTARVGPMSISFITPNIDDYTLALSDKPNVDSLSDAEKYIGENSGGVKLGRVFNRRFNNLVIMTKDSSPSILDHEQQHVLNALFLAQDSQINRDALNELRTRVTDIQSPEQRSAFIKIQMRHLRRTFEHITADEIMAYHKDGRDDEIIKQILTESNLYNYAAGIKNRIDTHAIAGENTDLLYDLKQAEELVFGVEYKQIVTDGIAILRTLRNKGLTKEQAFGLLSQKPLEQWPKILKRFKPTTKQYPAAIAA